MKKYDPSFWLFLAIMAGITGITLLINIYSPVSVKELTEKTGLHIEIVKESLEDIQEKFDQYGRMIDQFVEENTDFRLTEEEIDAIESEFLLENDFIMGTCYQIVTDHVSNIFEKYIDRTGIREVPLSQIIYFSEDEDQIVWNPKREWRKVFYEDTGEECFLYTRPILHDEQVIGYMGMLLSSAKIRDQIEKVQESLAWDYFIFANKMEAERAIGKIEWDKGYQKETFGYLKKSTETGEQIYTFKLLGTGMVYAEMHEGEKRTQYSNGMILLISVFSIAAMWMVQGRNRNGQTVFEQVSNYIMKNYMNEINPTQKQGYRATIILNIGMVIAIFADVVYSITLGRGVKTLSEYLVFFVMSFSVLILYRCSKRGITKKMALVIIFAGLIGPMVEHIISGGFAMRRAGDSFLWFIVCLYIALFILGTKKAVHILNIVVILLFLDVVLETILFQQTNYEGSYLFAIGFILLGFALYNAMDVYVSGADRHYNQTKKLIEEVNKNQDLLLQKEKLGALGQLIAGVVHEINTPIGAIKASAETMDSLFVTTLQEILDTAETYTNEEYEAFLELVSMTMEAKQKMKSTLEVRIAKKEVKKYFEEIDLKRRDEILFFLGELEIVNLDQIKERLELFQMKHITDLLERVTKLTAFSSGIPIILYASDRVSQIVLALKSYVHTSTIGEKVEFDLIRSIENVLILFRNQLKSNIKVTKVYGNNQFTITGNPDELAQVWTNLIQNAIHAMNGSGELTIKIKELDEKTVVVSVGDTGNGIVPELLDKIYDPFFTTKKMGESNGLGLSISKKIIENHNGVIEVESRVGKGTIFHIYLNKIT